MLRWGRFLHQTFRQAQRPTTVTDPVEVTSQTQKTFRQAQRPA